MKAIKVNQAELTSDCWLIQTNDEIQFKVNEETVAQFILSIVS